MMSFVTFFMTYGLIVLELICNLFSDHVAIQGFFRTRLESSCDERAPLIDKKDETVGTYKLSFLQCAEFTTFTKPPASPRQRKSLIMQLNSRLQCYSKLRTNRILLQNKTKTPMF